MVEGLDEWVEGIVKGETMAANDGNVATTSLTVGGDNGEVSTLRNGHITQIYKVLGLIVVLYVLYLNNKLYIL